MHKLLTFLIVCVVAQATISFAHGGDLRSTVSLILTKATAERLANDTLIRCEIRLENETDSDLTVRSNFTSAFDGLEIVVTTVDGKTLAQQSYAFHQSPFSMGRDFLLKKGTTTATIGFPISDFSRDVTEIKVRLVGTLPGSSYKRILSTETLTVKIPPM